MDLVRRLSLVSQSHVSNLEAGRKLPSLDLVIQVAELFRMPTEYLLRDTIGVEDVHGQLQAVSSQQASGLHSFGRKLRYLRSKSSMTQRELADRLALTSHAFVSVMETGHKEPSLSLVLHIADVFGVTTDYLLCDSISVEDTSYSQGRADSI